MDERSASSHSTSQGVRHEQTGCASLLAQIRRVHWLINKGKVNELNATIAGLRGERSILERQKADLETKVKEYPGQIIPTGRQWLSNLAEVDKTAIKMAVLILDCQMGPHLDEDLPHVSFEFKFFNASIYPILLNTVEGFILFGKKRLEKEITISTKWASMSVPHARLHSIEILQWLTNEEADTIRHDRTEPDSKKRTSFQFNLKHLRIMIDGGVNGERIVSKPLRFHRDAAITLEGKRINF